jgi:alpha-aminoadipate/glutamate carrier protein LysW
VAPVFATCPVCKQKLALQEYVVVGSEVVCANCETNLRVEKHNPLRLVQIPIQETFNASSRPESYG